MIVTGNSFVKIGGSFIDYNGPFVSPEPPVDHYFQLTNHGYSSAVLYVTSGSRGQIFVNEEYVGSIGSSQSSFLIPAGGVVKITGLIPIGSSWNSGTLNSDSSSNDFSIDRFDDTVSNPDYMFCRFTGLRSITSWTGAGNYTTLHDTFAICKELSSIPTSWSGLGNVTQLIGTFNSCALTTIPSSYDGLGKLTIANNVFNTGEEGTTATILSGGDSGFTQLSNITSCNGLFRDQANWTGDALSLYDYLSTKSITVTEHRNTFSGCVNAIGYSQIPESWGGPGSYTYVNIGGYSYKAKTFGNQMWLCENLRLDVGANCWRSNDSTQTQYGRYYRWKPSDLATIDAALPDGWHVPSMAEWQTLANWFDTNGSVSNKNAYLMKSTTWDGLGEFGFNVIQTGMMRYGTNLEYTNETNFSTTTVYDSGGNYRAYFRTGNDHIGFDPRSPEEWNPIRLVKNV